MAIVYGMGLLSGYGLWGRNKSAASETAARQAADLAALVNPPEGYTLPVSYGTLGPALIAGGVIDPAGFLQVYEQAGQPLTPAQQAALTLGSDEPVVFSRESAYFLLNFFWAVGLANQNPILTDGPIQTASAGGVEGLASTGSWTLATRPVGEIFAALPLIALTADQQALLEDVTRAVYRPCCDNPTHMPDCNHGMAMLGLLELMASQNASREEMFEAAKYANAFWYPAQTQEMALYFQKVQGLDFAEIDAERLVGREFSSGTSFQRLHQYLATQGWLNTAPGPGSSCGV